MLNVDTCLGTGILPRVQSPVGPSLSFMMENDDPLSCYKSIYRLLLAAKKEKNEMDH